MLGHDVDLACSLTGWQGAKWLRAHGWIMNRVGQDAKPESSRYACRLQHVT
jgi:hypothetical protein